MANTPIFGWPYLTYGDAPDLAAATSGLANGIENTLSTKYSKTALFRTDGISGAGTITIGTNPVAITTWHAPTFNIGGLISFSSGMATILAGGDGYYIPGLTMQWPSATVSYRVSQFFEVNGVDTEINEGEMQFSNGMGSQHLTCGSIPIRLVATNTIRARVVGSTNGIAGIQPVSFSLTKVA